jgi:hypothetical protein
MILSGTIVYVGGHFTNVSSQRRNHLAALEVHTGAVTSWDPDVSGSDEVYVEALAVQGDTVYTGGRFTSVGGQPRTNLAALEITTGNPTTWTPNPNNTVHTLIFSKAAIYIGGDFTTITERRRLGLAGYNIFTQRVLLPLITYR